MKHLFLSLIFLLAAQLAVAQSVETATKLNTLNVTFRLNPDVYPGNKFIYMYVGQTIEFDTQFYLVFDHRFSSKENPDQAIPNEHLSCISATDIGVECYTLWRHAFFTADAQGNPANGNYPDEGHLPHEPYNGIYGSGGRANEFVRFSQYISSKPHIFSIQALKPGLIIWGIQACDYTNEKEGDRYIVRTRVFGRTLCILPENPGFPPNAPGVYYHPNFTSLPSSSLRAADAPVPADDSHTVRFFDDNDHNDFINAYPSEPNGQ